MAYDSAVFLFLLSLTVLGMFILPGSCRKYWLLAAGMVFYLADSVASFLLLAGMILLTYCGAFWLTAEVSARRLKCRLTLLLAAVFSALVVCKYTGLIRSAFTALFSINCTASAETGKNPFLPLGISFFTFQAAAYLIDVYRGQLTPERNLADYALLISFFPKLISGPLERPSDFLTQVKTLSKRKIRSITRLRQGCLLIFWGYFLKLVIAERCSMVTEPIYSGYTAYGFWDIFLASLLYTLRIYCDFEGYMCISRGAARLMGFELRENFHQPYFALSIRDFWKRWHISLTDWFRRYLYIPLGGNRHGTVQKYINFMIVFLVSGFWHGANWNFAVWGLLHAFLQIFEQIADHFCRTQRLRENFLLRTLRCLLTFLLVNFAWVFFAADGTKRALRMIRHAFSHFQNTGFAVLDLHPGYWLILLSAVFVLVIVDLLHERGVSVFRMVEALSLPLRWGLYLALIWCVILMGIYGPGYSAAQFIYARF